MLQKWFQKSPRPSRNKNAIPRVKTNSLRLWVESLEDRVVPSSLPPAPDPYSRGEQSLLRVVDSLSMRDIENALDHFPVPYIIYSGNGNSELTPIAHNKAGAPTRIDVDQNKATGMGGSGQDLKIEVNTELSPERHLVLSIERLGDTNFAEDYTVLISFPFEAFNDETLPGMPNLLIGFQTTASGDVSGGHAPQRIDITFTPNQLAGTDHTYNYQAITTGSDNPLRLLGGHFDSTFATGILNASVFAAHVETAEGDVPESLSMQIDVNNSFPLGSPIDSEFALNWQASEAATVRLDYIEEEAFTGGNPDFHTALVVEQMPTAETFSLDLDEGNGTLTLSHRGSASVGQLAVLHERDDGLKILGQASDLPTEVDLTLGLRGAANLNVNANTLNMRLQASKSGGFQNTSQFFGYDLGYVALEMYAAPDLSAGFDGSTTSYSVLATNSGESMPFVEMILDEDGQIADDGSPLNLELPPSYADSPPHHLWSLVDDGTHGTAVARVVHAVDATYAFDPNLMAKTLHLETTQPAPMQTYLRFGPDSTLIPPDPNEDIEITCDIDVIPRGIADLHFNGVGSFGYTLTPPPGEAPATIASIHCFGHVGNFSFDVDAGDLPPVFDFDFDPDSHLTVLAENGLGGPATVGHVAVRFSDPDGFAPTQFADTTKYFGVALKDARLRVDKIPSFHGTWGDDSNVTSVHFQTDAVDAYVEGIQIAVSNEISLDTPLPAANPDSDHYARFRDDGSSGTKSFALGMFQLDSFDFVTNDTAQTVERGPPSLGSKPSSHRSKGV